MSEFADLGRREADVIEVVVNSAKLLLQRQSASSTYVLWQTEFQSCISAHACGLNIETSLKGQTEAGLLQHAMHHILNDVSVHLSVRCSNLAQPMA